MSSFQVIWSLSRGERTRYLGAILALIAASCFLYLAPLIPQIVLDGVISDAPERASNFVHQLVNLLGGRTFLAANLWWPALLIVLITVIAGVFTYLRGRWSAYASEAIARRVRERVYDHLQRLPARYFDQAETGDVLQRATSDVETLRVFLATQVVEIGRAVIMLLVPIPLMLMIDVRMTVLSIIVLPVIVFFSCFVFLKIKKTFQAVDEAEAALTSTLQENLTGIRVVRAFARQTFEKNRFGDANRKHRGTDYRLYMLLAWYWASSDLLCMLQKALVVIAGAVWLARGELQIGAFFFFLSAVTMFLWPVRMMGRILADLGKAMVAVNRLREILEVAPEAAPDEAGREPVPLRGEIAFDQVTFSHAENAPVLHDISFSVAPGETLALLGPSGCGKSTIIALLLRLYELDEGRILLDGRDLRDLDRRDVRRRIAVVLQEPFLYSRSLRENIKIARQNLSDEAMVEAASIASVHDSIQQFEEGYDTIVGERGVTLSGGQRQRVAIARALVQEPAILILDDSLSAVDNETEGVILDAIRQRQGRHTTILIAHRLGTIMHADRILVLEHGRIVQAGRHEELIAAEGLYRRLWRIQSAEIEDDTETAPSHSMASTDDQTHHDDAPALSAPRSQP